MSFDPSPAEIQKMFIERINSLDEDDILEINRNSSSADINNVVVGLRVHCYGIWVVEEEGMVDYQLFYINGAQKLEGFYLQLSLNLLFRDSITFSFASFLAHNYDDLDPIDTFNTFQSQARSMFEKLEYLTVTNKDIEKYEDPVFFAPNRKGIVKINFLDRCAFYKDLFGDLSERPLLSGRGYIYLMLNTRNNYIKIGKSIRPNFREKTLQAEEPTIVLIACWEAPAHKERELHKLFAPQRVRGEWFNLKLKDIKMLQEFMQEFCK